MAVFDVLAEYILFFISYETRINRNANFFFSFGITFAYPDASYVVILSLITLIW